MALIRLPINIRRRLKPLRVKTLLADLAAAKEFIAAVSLLFYLAYLFINIAKDF
jgi:hypothetical protein